MDALFVDLVKVKEKLNQIIKFIDCYMKEIDKLSNSDISLPEFKELIKNKII